MAKNETDSGLFVALNYFSHLTLCLSEKMRRCFKSSDIFEKTSDFFHSLAVTDSTTLESGIRGGVNKKNQWNRVGKSRPSMENSIIIIFFSFFKPSLGSSKCIFSFFPHCTNILDICTAATQLLQQYFVQLGHPNRWVYYLVFLFW